MTKKYIDIRLHLSKEVEDFGPDERYDHFEITGVERIKFKGIDEDQLQSLAESVAQMDKYQIEIHSAIVSSIDSEGVYVI